MTTQVLLLNADYKPLKIIPWEKAVVLLLDQKVYRVEDYADRVIRSSSIVMEWPAVVALKRYVQLGNRVRFNRKNVLARDAYTCQYCGDRPLTPSKNPRLEDLSIDHVIPRAQAKRGKVYLPWSKRTVSVTCWLNVVASCCKCNAEKADRTPAQAGMTLTRYPRRPTTWDAIRMTLTRTAIPDEWKNYVPEEWRGYWDDELDAN